LIPHLPRKERDPVADSTENGINRVTSGRRALIAAWVRQATNLPTLYAAAWADACAALVEDNVPLPELVAEPDDAAATASRMFTRERS
jgi:hypothetical protein